MKRVIKFRVWTGNKMIYPSEYNRTCMPYEQICYYPNHRDDKSDVFKIMYAEGGWNDNWEQQEVMQFTGRTDKNGKDIYEGDIMMYSNGVKTEVEWSQNERFGVNNDGYDFHCDRHEYEVIGNIYENKELLA